MIQMIYLTRDPMRNVLVNTWDGTKLAPLPVDKGFRVAFPLHDRDFGPDAHPIDRLILAHELLVAINPPSAQIPTAALAFADAFIARIAEDSFALAAATVAAWGAGFCHGMRIAAEAMGFAGNAKPSKN
jgi:hypothetical protein